MNFNGTGTVAIRGSGNVSSITDNGNGDYTVNLATAMVDANYSVSGSQGGTGSPVGMQMSDQVTARTSSLFRFIVFNYTFTLVDCSQLNVAVFR